MKSDADVEYMTIHDAGRTEIASMQMTILALGTIWSRLWIKVKIRNSGPADEDKLNDFLSSIFDEKLKEILW